MEPTFKPVSTSTRSPQISFDTPPESSSFENNNNGNFLQRDPSSSDPGSFEVAQKAFQNSNWKNFDPAVFNRPIPNPTQVSPENGDLCRLLFQWHLYGQAISALAENPEDPKKITSVETTKRELKNVEDAYFKTAIEDTSIPRTLQVETPPEIVTVSKKMLYAEAFLAIKPNQSALACLTEKVAKAQKSTEKSNKEKIIHFVLVQTGNNLKESFDSIKSKKSSKAEELFQTLKKRESTTIVKVDVKELENEFNRLKGVQEIIDIYGRVLWGFRNEIKEFHLLRVKKIKLSVFGEKIASLIKDTPNFTTELSSNLIFQWFDKEYRLAVTGLMDNTKKALQENVKTRLGKGNSIQDVESEIGNKLFNSPMTSFENVKRIFSNDDSIFQLFDLEKESSDSKNEKMREKKINLTGKPNERFKQMLEIFGLRIFGNTEVFCALVNMVVSNALKTTGNSLGIQSQTAYDSNILSLMYDNYPNYSKFFMMMHYELRKQLDSALKEKFKEVSTSSELNIVDYFKLIMSLLDKDFMSHLIPDLFKKSFDLFEKTNWVHILSQKKDENTKIKVVFEKDLLKIHFSRQDEFIENNTLSKSTQTLPQGASLSFSQIGCIACNLKKYDIKLESFQVKLTCPEEKIQKSMINNIPYNLTLLMGSLGLPNPLEVDYIRTPKNGVVG